jgi:transposase
VYRRFSSPAKLARYAGIAPVTYASGKKDMQFSNQRGNRELNSLIHQLALRLVGTPSKDRTVTNAMKCVERRLVNIVWRMLTYNEEYINPPTFEAPTKETND